MSDEVLKRIYALAPDQFENLIYECVRARGMQNLVWRTPGADGGRDIEGATYDVDLSGLTDARRWYVECKRHKTTLDWPTVRGKVAYAESNDADVLLVATTANPTPQCETEIGKWNAAKRRPQIRFWRGYDLPNIVRGVPQIAAIFGLATDLREANASLIPLAEVATHIAQAGYARIYFNKDDYSSIETVAAISELFSVRLKDLRDFGRAVCGPSVRDARLFEWLTVEGNLSNWDDTCLRAIVSFLKYEHQATEAFIHSDSDGVTLTLEGGRADCAGGLPTDRDVVSFWARISALPTEHPNVWILERLPYGQ